jgi:putative transposase
MRKNNNILSYAQYRKKIESLKTPEEMAEFTESLDASEKIEKSVDQNPASIYQDASTQKTYQPNTQNAWCDIVANNTEAMVIDLYAKGLTTRDISNHLKKAHNIDITQPSISVITDKVFPLVKEWQSRPLASRYAAVYLDGLHFKVRDTGKISSKVAYIALGIDLYGKREILGIWISESEGAKFWMHVLNELKSRGVEDILIACIDGLKGFPEAIKAIFPHTDIQLCVVHQIRHTIMFIASKHLKSFSENLKSIYTAPTEAAGMEALKEMKKQWPQYAAYLKSWENKWTDLAPFFSYPEPIRKMIYTTNAIESLNRQFRKVTKTTQVFPHDDALLKLLWLAQADIVEKWLFATRNWGEIMAQLSILFPDRIQF